MPTHGDYPWERDERKRGQDSPRAQPQPQRIAPPPGTPRPPMAYSSGGGPRRRRRSSNGGVLAPMLIVAAIAAMLYGGFTIAEEPAPYAAPAYVQPQPAQPQPRPQPQEPSVRDTVRGRLKSAARRRVSWPMRMKSRFVAPGVLEVWGSTPAPDGATITVAVRPSTGGRWQKLGDAPVAKGHFLIRESIAQSLQGQRVSIRARFG